MSLICLYLNLFYVKDPLCEDDDGEQVRPPDLLLLHGRDHVRPLLQGKSRHQERHLYLTTRVDLTK